MESTGSYSLLAATVLYEAGHAVSVLNPRWIKDHARSDGRRNKTDTLDAEIIAHYGLTHDPDLWQPASPAAACGHPALGVGRWMFAPRPLFRA